MIVENLTVSINNLTPSINNIINNLSLLQATETLQPLILFIVGMVVYSIFVFKFYKFISRKDIFRVSKGENNSAIKKLGYVMEYLFLFPVIAFCWFLILSILLALLSDVIMITNIFTVSMATLATIRITTYYDEDLSRDIAKLIPLALLAVFLIELTSFSSEVPLGVLSQIPTVLDTIIYYFIFIVILEFILRLIFHGKPKLTT